MRFCDKLAKERKNNNLSQEQLADKLGVSRQAVSKWESSSSYPDMDKIIQITKILNCTLEDLLDDGTIGNTNSSSKFNMTNYLQDFLKFITKTYNMFCSMTFKEKFKCLLELFILGIILMTSMAIINEIVCSFILDLFTKIPRIGYSIRNTLDSLFIIILIILSVIIFIHLFKVRYLDYFITIEDSNVTEKTIEDPIDKKENKCYREQQREKIVIRDPKHSTMSFYHFLIKVIILMLKLATIFFLIPTIFLFVFLIITGVISLGHTTYSLIFLFIALACIASSGLCYIVIYFIYNFIFNKEINFKKSFIIIIISLIVIGVSIGMSFITAMNYEYIDNYNDLSKITKTESIDITPTTKIHSPYIYNDEDIEYIIDNSLEKAKIELTYLSDSKYNITHHKTSDTDLYYIDSEGLDFFTAYKILTNDLKHKIFRNYDNSTIIRIKIYLSENAYNILKQNNIEYESY